jgi:galactose mutarotase-like enzyme
MEQTIKNEILEFSVNLKGAELFSIRDVRTGQQYMWEANPAIWGSTAPVLFPIIGCLKDDSYLFNGKEYTLPRHGFIRGNEKMELEYRTQDRVSFSLQYSQEILKIYPFRFKFIIDYILDGNKIRVWHRILNLGDGEMFFSLGGHPAFKCPIFDDEKYSDYFLEFDREETSLCYGPMENGLIGPETRSIIENDKFIYLNTNTFDKGALVFKKLNSSGITLVNKKRGPVIRVDFHGFPYLGIWAKPNAPFVCIEPWLGIADNWNSDRKFETKEGILLLTAGEKFEASFSIEIFN